ncbi:hypothetical protein BDV97DRAFT_388573 [Delphinella strobiligena]|nr:hypothetical protein BDV97DRAFT_388573 [Delphinella strobiligena]
MATPQQAHLSITCHCKAITITFPPLREPANECLCNICRRYGALWAYYKPDEVRVEGDEIEPRSVSGPASSGHLGLRPPSVSAKSFVRSNLISCETCGMCACRKDALSRPHPAKSSLCYWNGVRIAANGFESSVCVDCREVGCAVVLTGAGIRKETSMSHSSSYIVSDETIAFINGIIAADVQADQQAAAAVRNQVPIQRPQPPTCLPALPKGRHKVGHACPEGNDNCHFHYSLEPCHKPRWTCEIALRESSLRFNAKNFLNGAPVRWNEEHTLCVAPGAHPSQMCQDHFDIYAETLPSNER